MKTYTATQLNKSAQEVFAAAKEEGSVLIEHDRYPGGSFSIEWKPNNEGEAECEHECDDITAICNKCGEQCMRIYSYVPLYPIRAHYLPGDLTLEDIAAAKIILDERG